MSAWMKHPWNALYSCWRRLSNGEEREARKGNGRPQDFAKAIHWYTLAADQGYAWAQYQLGRLYFSVKGVKQDFVQAYMWLNLAAGQGVQEAVTERRKLLKEKEFTSDQVAEAQKLSREWTAKGE